jgi:uncharacterized delta-60 repeat protein
MALRRITTWQTVVALIATLLVPAAVPAGPGSAAPATTDVPAPSRFVRAVERLDNIQFVDVVIDTARNRYFLASNRRGAETVRKVRANGSIDTSFGVQGVVSLPTLIDATAMVVDGDALLIAGSAWGTATTGDDPGAVVRLGVDGAIDTSFGVDGVATVDIVGQDVRLDDIVLDSTGRIVVSGARGRWPQTQLKRQHLFVARLTPSGEFDASFASDGVSDVDVPGWGQFLLATDTGYVVGGARATAPETTWSLTRLTQTGALDTTFATGGSAPIDAGVIGIGATTQARIAVGISVGVRPGVAVFDSSGRPDPGFADDGIISFDLGLDLVRSRSAFTVRPDGRLLLTAVDGRIVRTVGLRPDGRLDTTVGRLGWAATSDWYDSGAGPSILAPLALDEVSNTVELAGWQIEDEGEVTGVRGRISLEEGPPLRFPASNRQATYGSSGRVAVVGSIVDSVVRPSGKLVVLALRSDGPHRTFAVEKRLRNGRLDPTFGDAGTYTFPTPRGLTVPNAVAIQGPSILVAFTEYGTEHPSVVITRLTQDGELDTTFGKNGRRAIRYPGSLHVTGLIVDAAGRVVVAGVDVPLSGAPSNAVIVRLRTNGSVDGAFGTDGISGSPLNRNIRQLPVNRGPVVHGLTMHGRGYVVAVNDPQGRILRVTEKGTRWTSCCQNLPTDSSGDTPIYALATAPSTKVDGRRMAADQWSGRTQSHRLWLLENSGAPVRSFGNDGRRSVPRGEAPLLAFRSKGRVLRTVIQPPATAGAPPQVTSTTYLSDGSIDPSTPTLTANVPALRSEFPRVSALVHDPSRHPGLFYVLSPGDAPTGLGEWCNPNDPCTAQSAIHRVVAR